MTGKNVFATAFMDYFNNELTIEFCLAVDAFDAMKQRLEQEGYTVDNSIIEIQEIKQFAFDCDSMIDAAEVV